MGNVSAWLNKSTKAPRRNVGILRAFEGRGGMADDLGRYRTNGNSLILLEGVGPVRKREEAIRGF